MNGELGSPSLAQSPTTCTTCSRIAGNTHLLCQALSHTKPQVQRREPSPGASPASFTQGRKPVSTLVGYSLGMPGVEKLQGLGSGLAQDPVWLCQQLLLDLRKGPTDFRKFYVFHNLGGHPVHTA